MDKSLQDKVAIITGAGSGIGRQSALLFAQKGAKVVVADIVEEAGDGTVQLIREQGGDASFIRTDVSNASSVQAMVDHALTTYGRLDCAFNNAGIEGESTSTVKCTDETWEKTIAVDLKGVWLCMKYQILAMEKTAGGAIVNTASVAGLAGTPGLPAYCAAKFGVVSLTKTAAIEYARQNIRVNAVCPGVIRTPMVDRLMQDNPKVEKTFNDIHPIGRLGEPADIGYGAAWLCSDESAFVTGLALPLDGGLLAAWTRT